MKNKLEADGDLKIRCGICGNDVDTEQATTLRCSHTFCFQCIKTNHETAVMKKQSESDKLYCPRCAEITAVPDGAVENIRPFYLCNRVKDLHTLSQMHRELVNNNEDQASEKAESKTMIDSRSYTIEGPTLDDVKEVENELLERGQVDDLTPSAQLAEPDDEASLTAEHSLTEELKNGGSRYSCSVCQASDIVYYCFYCGDTLCGTCKQSHAENEASRSHYGIDISNERIQALVCPTHSEFIRQFCAGCFEAVCITCRTANHENHEIYDFCTSEEASQLIAEVGKRRMANEYVLREVDKLKGELSARLEAMNNDIDTFVQKTRSSDDFVSPLKGHIQQCLEEMQKGLHKMESEILKNTHSLDTYEAIRGTNIYVQRLGDFAIKYTISELYDVVLKDLRETIQYETVDILVEKTQQTEEDQQCMAPAEYKIEEQRDFCLAPTLIEVDSEQMLVDYSFDELVEKHRYMCEMEQIENAFDNETAERSEQTEIHKQLEENDCTSSEAACKERQRAQTSESTMSADDARSETLILDKEIMMNKVPDPGDNGATKVSVKETPPNVNNSTADAERSESIDDTEMYQQVRLKEEVQQLPKVLVSETCQIPGRNATDEHISENPSGLNFGSSSEISRVTGDTSEQNDPSAEIMDICEQQTAWKTHERVWSVRQSARSVDFLPSGNILATGRDKLQAIDARGGKLPAPFDTSVLSDPWKLAVHEATSTVVVVDPTINAFTVFTPNSQNDLTPSSERWSCQSHYIKGIHVPMCAAFTHDGHVLLATGSGRTLLKYSVSGELLWQRSLAHDCYYLTTDKGGRIITSGGGSVHIHDENGIELHHFPESKEQLRDPWGVATDSENNIYVCELNRPIVTVFSSTGKYIRELDLNSWPRDIAVQDDKILIASVHSIEMHQMKRE